MISCHYVMHTFRRTSALGAWISRYYNAKRNNTILDEKELAATSKKVEEFCHANPNVGLMYVIEQIFEGALNPLGRIAGERLDPADAMRRIACAAIRCE